jgi:hypothetical protein
MSTRQHRPDPDRFPAPDIDPIAADDPDLADLIAQTGINIHDDGRPVRVTVWRVAATRHSGHRDWGDGLSPRVAGLLIGLNTRAGDTVVDFDADPALHGAAGANGVRYVPITDPAQAADLTGVAGTARLISLRYPRPNAVATGPATLSDLFTACALLQAPDGCTVVAIVPTPGGEPYITHARQVIPAAGRAGLGYVQHIIAVTTPTAGKQFTDPASPTNGDTPRAARPRLRNGSLHLDLLVFVLREVPHDRRSWRHAT